MNGPSLKLILDEQWKQERRRILLQRFEADLPFYRLLQEHQSLEEFNWETYCDIVIWCDNGTAILISEPGHDRDMSWEVPFTVKVGKYQLVGAMYHNVGDEVGGVLGTALFFGSLHQTRESNVRLEIDFGNYAPSCDFDFAEALTPDKLAIILDASASRKFFFFKQGEWSAKQSVVLATRPYRIEFKLGEDTSGFGSFSFEDEGNAFVDALETRQSSFGSLFIEFKQCEIPFSHANLRRLFNLDFYFDRLVISALDEKCAFLLFSSKTNALEYEFEANYFEQSDFDSLNMVAEDLSILITFDVYSDEQAYNDNWDMRLVSFLNRLAKLGHFKRLKISISCSEEPTLEKTASIRKAFVGVITGNRNLSVFDLSGSSWHFDRAFLLQEIFMAMEEHRGLRTFVIEYYPPNDTNYSWLNQLLSRNRNITVLDLQSNRCSDRFSIDKLYAVNRLYNGTVELVKESRSLRPSLVGMTLVESALNDFQRTTLLLSQHTDVVCKLLQCLNPEDNVAPQSVMEEVEMVASLPHDADESAPKKLRSSFPYF